MPGCAPVKTAILKSVMCCLNMERIMLNVVILSKDSEDRQERDRSLLGIFKQGHKCKRIGWMQGKPGEMVCEEGCHIRSIIHSVLGPDSILAVFSEGWFV